MIATTLVLMGILVILTGWVTHRVRHREIKAVWVAPLWGGGACLVLASVAGVYYVNQVRIYDRCVATAERSIGGRAQSEQLYDTVDVVTGTDHYTADVILTGRPSLREAIDVNLPVLDPNDCEKP